MDVFQGILGIGRAVNGLRRAVDSKIEGAVVRSARWNAIDMRVFTCRLNSIRQWPWNPSQLGRVSGACQRKRGTNAHHNAFGEAGRYGRDHLDRLCDVNGDRGKIWHRNCLHETRRCGMLRKSRNGATAVCTAERLGACKSLPGQSPSQWILDLNLFGQQCV